MQPENNLNTQALEPTEELAPPVQMNQPVESVVEQQDIMLGGDKKKKNLNNVIIMAVLAVLAVAGLIFGVVMMLNNSGANKNENASRVFENPKIVSPNDSVEWGEYYTSSMLYVNDGVKNVGLMVKDGEVRTCEVYGTVETPTEDGKDTIVQGEVTECVLSGLAGDVYKIVELRLASMSGDFYIGFIMTDGSVYYVEATKAIEKNDFEATGPISVGGYVVDAIEIDVEPADEDLAGGVSTVFVLQDGSLVELKESMLK